MSTTALVSPLAVSADRLAVPGHVIPLIAAPGVERLEEKRADGGEITLTIVLRRRDEGGFQRDLAALYDPASPTYRQWLAPLEISERYGPSADDFAIVERHFADEGFRIAERSSNRLTLLVAAPRATVERALDVDIADYRLRDPQGHVKRVFANDREPSLPAAVAARVMAINGLSSIAQPRPLIIEAIKKAFCGIKADFSGFFSGLQFKDPRTACEETATACASEVKLSAESLADLIKACEKWKAPPVTPERAAAGDPPVAWKDANGSGQKIGITAFSAFLTSDVADTLELFGYNPSLLGNLSRVAVNGGAALEPDQTEVVLDATTALTGAPGAQVVVYDMPFGGGAFQTLFNRMITDGVSIITNSWAYCENQTSFADVSSIDAILATAAAAGITVVTASGDSGSTCLNGSPNTIVVPAGLPHVTAVGGTSLEIGPGVTWKSATWWGAISTPPTGQGGFGVSRFFVRPSWQNGFTSSPYRSIPDLAFQADPARGVSICVAANGSCPSNNLYGGTSYAAPAIAAAVAKMNHAAGRRLGFLNPQIYPLANSGAFNTPATLGSDFAHVGLGTPIFNRLHLALTGGVAGPVSAAQSIVEAEQNRVAADGTGYTSIVVKLRDASGNIVPGKNVALTHNGGSAVTVTPPSATTNATNGAVVFEVRGTAVQDVTFTATDTSDGIVLAQTVPVKFDVPPATAGSINAFPTSVLNDGVATTTIVVTLQDARGLPTPGKTVTLSQGGGHSIISGPSPSVTDVNGQIQFTATNRFAETVVYTAVDVTDGDLPVPGNASVTFSGTANTSCVGPTATPGAGFALAPFATGFVAGDFFYSNVNWFGCPGATNPGFGPSGDVYVSNFRTGILYRLGATGGAASPANELANLGLTLAQPVFGKDGRLYAVRATTGSGFSSGALYELDPQTGAIVRTLATGLTCANGLAVDPLSGDLFFDNSCFGAGANDNRLFRVNNPGGASPTVTTYVTLPTSPNGALAFSPDGTLYVVSGYTQAGGAPVLRIGGTNTPQPPTMTPVPGLLSTFWVNVGETLPGGAAKSLIVSTADNALKLADITTNPPTLTTLATPAMSSGVIGPDGCLYTSASDTVYKLTSAGGGCGFSPTNPAPGIVLTPATTTPDPAQGTSKTLTAKLVGIASPAGTPIHFRIGGANEDYAMVRADANGEATFTYVGRATGRDTIVADAKIGALTLTSNRAALNWVAGAHQTLLTLNTSALDAVVGSPVMLTAALVDQSVDPAVPVAGATLQFSVGGQVCNAVTNASGIASCAVTLPATGNFTLTVTYAGSPSFLAATAMRSFTVTAAPPPPCSTFNDVDSTSPFCVNVAWIRNRSVTLGCTVALYCPVDVVSRLQMAAFMNRLGTALGIVALIADVQSGVVNLDAQAIACQTEDFATGTFARRALVDATFSARGSAAVGFAADAVASFDGGATWNAIAAIGNRTFAPTDHWGHVRASGVVELDAGQTVRFGVRVTRGGLPGSAHLADSTCKVRAAVSSR